MRSVGCRVGHCNPVNSEELVVQLSNWLNRCAAYNRGNTTVVPTKAPHVVRYRHYGSRVTVDRRFDTDKEMQAYIKLHRRVEVWSETTRSWHCTRKGDWSWFECYVDNVMLSNH
jgi:hypothetical protein